MNRDTTLSDREQLIERREAFSGKLLRLVVDRVRLASGRRSTREVVLHPGAVAILPHMSDGTILLVRQYRHAVGCSLWEIPAGKIEPGEQPLITARRELLEETGYGASSFKRLLSFYTSPGFTDERIVLFQAQGLNPMRKYDGREISQVVPFDPATIARMIDQEKIRDGKTLLALFALGIGTIGK